MTSPDGLSVGFARHDITPAGALELSGFVARTGTSTGVHDPLCARAAVLDDGNERAALIAVDLIGVDRSLVSEIRNAAATATGIKASRISVVATHTHGAPAVLRHAQLGQPDPGYLQAVIHGAASAVARAAASLQPCHVRHARAEQPDVASNRRDPAGPTDPAVDVLRFDAADRCLGLITTYACHPVVLGADNLLITRDYPGWIVDRLEAEFPGAVAVFMNGCAGQLNTGHRAHDSWSAASTPQRTFAEAARIGTLVADSAVRAAATAAAQTPLDFAPLITASASVKLTMNRDLALDAPWSATPAAGEERTDLPRAVNAAYLRWADSTAAAPLTRETELQAIGFCGRALAIHPGEVFVEYGLRLKDRFPHTVIPVAYGNDAPGYLPSAASHSEGGYELQEAHRFYGQPGPVEPATEDLIVQAMTRLVQAVLASETIAHRRNNPTEKGNT